MTPQNHNLYSHYQKQFIKFKNKPALRLIDNKTIYYKDLEKESAKIANYLRDLGVKIGDRVSVQ
ncbi:MAG: malonyl-CoA synthase, partial [Porticoccaceae bacterium]|nr:malonyl-CoA synthase [Porticoccaceae bacterium]